MLQFQAPSSRGFQRGSHRSNLHRPTGCPKMNDSRSISLTARLAILMIPFIASIMPSTRGLHSSTLQLNVSALVLG